MSKRARQPGPLRTLSKRLVLCLILAAVLQYLVAAGFGLQGTYGIGTSTSVLADPEFDTSNMFVVIRSGSMGRDVLKGVFSPDTDGRDWSHFEWTSADDDDDSKQLGDVSSSSAAPPAWSRFLRVRTDPNLDCFPRSTVIKGLRICFDVGCGWPMRSASYYAELVNVNSPFAVRDGLVVSNRLVGNNITPRVIPLSIYWPGTIENTLIYAAVLFALLTLIPLMRQYLRRRAGRCPTCNYDLRANTTGVCPECGHIISQASATES